MLTLLSVLGSLHSFRVRSRAALELELVAPRHQLTVLRRQRPGRPRLGKSIPWPDDVWRRAGRQISVPRQQLLVHRPRHVGQDTRPIHNGPLSRLSTTASRAVRKIVPDYLRHCFLTPPNSLVSRPFQFFDHTGRFRRRGGSKRCAVELCPRCHGNEHRQRLRCRGGRDQDPGDRAPIKRVAEAD